MKSFYYFGILCAAFCMSNVHAEVVTVGCDCETPTHLVVSTNCDHPGGTDCEPCNACAATSKCDPCVAPASCDVCVPNCGSRLGCDTAGDCCDDGGNICSTLNCSNCDDGGCALSCDVDCKPGCGCFKCCNGWTVLAEAMFLTREGGGPQTLIAEQATGNSLVTGDDYSFDYQVAPRLTLVRDLCNCWGWSVGYFGVDSLGESLYGGGNTSPVLIGPGLPFVSTAPGAVFGVDYGTDFDSLDFNLRHRCTPCVTMVAGFRMIELDDFLRGYSVSPTLTDLYKLRASNQMYGFQLGADAILVQKGRFQVNSTVRAGVMGNHLSVSATSPVTAGIPGAVGRTRSEASDTAFLGELGFRGGYQLGNGCSIYGGYHMLWLDGVALAPGQIRSTSLLGGGSSSIDNGSTLFLHGATVGIQMQF